MDPFSPLNFILFSFGCNFFRKSLWTRVFGWILFTLHALKLVFTLDDYRDISVGQILTKNTVTLTIWYLDYVFDIMFILIMAWNRRHFEEILRRLSDKVSITDKKSLWKLSIFGLIFSLSVSVKDMIAFNLEPVGSNYYRVWARVRDFIWTWSMKDSFLVCGRIVFCYFIRLVTLKEKRFLRSIFDQSLTPSSVSVKKRKLQKFRQFVVDKFSVIPVLWFLRELVFLVAVIVSRDFNWAKNNPIYFFMVSTSVAITSMATHTFMVCYIDYCVMDVRQEAERVATLFAQKDFKKWEFIIAEFQDKKDITTCSMIDINKRAGISFILNLITLTLLFEQLVSSLH